jgi:predicted enzyme related to lactoylglutathione lyase
MAVRTSYAPGTPCWADVSSPDIDSAVTFYGGLFGWGEFRVPDPEAHGYTMFQQGEHAVAAVMTTQEGGPPPMWSTYFSTEDVDASVAKIRGAGGVVLMEPFDVMEAGRMAVAQDPTGAVFHVWQPKQSGGATLVNEPVSMTWNELTTRDVPAANAFYSEIFGWESEAMPMPGAPVDYHLQKVDGDMVAGIMEMPAELGDAPPNWMVYFAVEDTDSAIARSEELGGSLLNGPMDTPYGPMAVLADPAGAVFSVIKLTQPAQ